MKNYKKVFLLSSIALAISGCNLTNSTPTVELATKQASTQLDIEKYTLDNGLDVILHQDKSDPVVAVAIQYHVGSNREKPGRTGFAHFFEHMLFQDSEHVGAGKFIKNIGAMGGSLNGGTWQDGTVYYETVPSDGLEKVLWMESDRMGYFINTVTAAGLENEKQVVKNEKRQGVDNRPYGHANSVTLKALYPKGHPYSWSVIGSLEDLQSATLQDVRDFYQQWYGVNNATLVLAGDFDKTQAKQWVQKYFSEFKARGDVTPLKPMPVTLSATKSLYHQDNFAKLPQLTMTYPTVDQGHKDQYALSMLAEILSDGKDSVLYQTLVEQDKVTPKVNAGVNHGEIAGTFALRVRTFSGVDLDKAKQSIDAALAKFALQGASDKQISRILTAKETKFYNGLTSVFSKASSLATANEFFGDPAYVTQEIEHYRQVSKKDIMRVFKQYILDKPFVATSFVPKGQLDLALRDAIKADVVEEKIIQGAEQKHVEKLEIAQLEPVAQTVSAFDRNIEPAYGKKPVVTLPTIWQKNLKNDVRVLGIEHNELPLVSFSIRIKGGHSLDKKGKSGSANLLTDILMEGTATKTPQQLEDAIGALGADLNFYADNEYIELSGNTLSKNFNATMALAQEILLEPRWDANEWERIKKQTLATVKQRAGSPGAIAAQVYAKLMYQDSNLGTPITGTPTEIAALTIEDIKAFYYENIVSGATSVHFAGNITSQQAMQSLSPLSNQLKQAELSFAKATDRVELDNAQLYFVDVPGAKQSFIRIGSRAMPANSGDYSLAQAVNHNLGGSFSGKLFQVLRLEKGYTYGAYSSFSRSNIGGTFTARSSVRSNVTLESLQTFREIFDSYTTSFDEASLDSAKSILAKQDARAFETTGNLIEVLKNITTYDLGTDYVAKKQQALNNMPLAKAKQLLKTYMDKDKMVYLVVGDAKTQLSRLNKLGLGDAILLNKEGELIK